MPLFMDRHQVPGASAEDVAAAHVSDLSVAGKHGVEFFSYWFDSDDGEVFCFAHAPAAKSMEEVHAESHGLIPAEIIEVSESDVVRFIGQVHDPADATEVTSAFRIIVFTDLVDSTEMLDRLGQSEYMVLLTEHDLILRKALAKLGGREVKHTGDGFLVSFDDAEHALRWATTINKTLRERTFESGANLVIRIGMSAGEPVDHNADIFGRAVTEASRISASAAPGQVLVSDAVQRLGREAGFRFSSGESLNLKGFSEPTLVHELVPSTAETGEQA